MKRKKKEVRERSRVPKSPERRRNEKGKEKMVEEAPKEVSNGRKKQFGDL